MIFCTFCDEAFRLPHGDGFVESGVRKVSFEFELDYY